MKKLEVRLTRQPGQERIVGQLAEAGPRPASRQVYFEYDPAFLRDPLWLSPFKLPPQPGLIEHRDSAFGPIFGLFDDSLPDGHLLSLAGPAGLSSRDTQAILDEVAAAAARWSAHARQAGVGRKTAKLVGSAIEECLARI